MPELNAENKKRSQKSKNALKSLSRIKTWINFCSVGKKPSFLFMIVVSTLLWVPKMNILLILLLGSVLGKISRNAVSIRKWLRTTIFAKIFLASIANLLSRNSHKLKSYLHPKKIASSHALKDLKVATQQRRHLLRLKKKKRLITIPVCWEKKPTAWNIVKFQRKNTLSSRLTH